MAGPIPLLGLLDELRDFANRRNMGQKLVGGGVRGAATRGLLGMDAPENATPIQREVYENAARAGAPVMGAGGLLAVAPAMIGKTKRVGEKISDLIEAKYPGVSLSLSGDKELYLGKIVVPKEDRSKGIGTKVMQDIINEADRAGSMVTLSPSSDFGGSVGRLKDFYKRFGFVENKGKNKDFSISESMYRPAQEAKIPEPPQAQALETARQNAVKMLGLPENNTAMDRAREMGFDTPAYRGTTADEVAGKARTFVSENPDVANQYAGYLSQFADDPKMLDAMMKLTPNGNVMPLLVRDAAKARARTNVPDYEMILDANQARSRFAAFDPARINENDLLASLAAMGISIPMILGLLDEERVD